MTGHLIVGRYFVLRSEDDGPGDGQETGPSSQADGGPEVGNLQDKQYHRSCYADEVHYGQGKQESRAAARKPRDAASILFG